MTIVMSQESLRMSKTGARMYTLILKRETCPAERKLTIQTKYLDSKYKYSSNNGDVRRTRLSKTNAEVRQKFNCHTMLGFRTISHNSRAK